LAGSFALPAPASVMAPIWWTRWGVGRR